MPLQDDWLSDWDTSLKGKRHLAPRVVDLSSLNNLKQADFVTYIPNPHFRRHQRYGVATRAVAALRNQRRPVEAPRSSTCVRASIDLLNIETCCSLTWLVLVYELCVCVCVCVVQDLVLSHTSSVQARRW